MTGRRIFMRDFAAVVPAENQKLAESAAIEQH
jgi:hypothetical protein